MCFEHLPSASFERERTWSRIMTGFPRGIYNLFVTAFLSHTNYPGDCVMSVGTDDKTAVKIRGIKLLPSHDYAVTGKCIPAKPPCIISCNQVSENPTTSAGSLCSTLACAVYHASVWQTPPATHAPVSYLIFSSLLLCRLTNGRGS